MNYLIKSMYIYIHPHTESKKFNTGIGKKPNDTHKVSSHQTELLQRELRAALSVTAFTRTLVSSLWTLLRFSHSEYGVSTNLYIHIPVYMITNSIPVCILHLIRAGACDVCLFIYLFLQHQQQAIFFKAEKNGARCGLLRA